MHHSTIEHLRKIITLEQIDCESIKDLKILISDKWEWDLIGLGDVDFKSPLKFNSLTYQRNGICDSSRFPVSSVLGVPGENKEIVRYNRDLPQKYQITIEELSLLYQYYKELPFIIGIEKK